MSLKILKELIIKLQRRNLLRNLLMKKTAGVLPALARPVLPVPPARSRSLVRPNC
jgi:hypothetical protein